MAQQVRQEAATAKEKACEKAKADYEKYIGHVRITRTDVNGNVTYMTPAEMDATRLQARANRDLACGP